jgi:hypothetical protein
LVHTALATLGPDAAVVWWATVFPKSVGIGQFSPAFKSVAFILPDVLRN